MAALHATSTYNVEASLNQWIVTKFATITLPLTVNYTFEMLETDKELVTPSFSVTHQPATRDDVFEGRMAVEARNVMQVTAWVNRSNTAWLAQKRAMASMIEALFASPAVIQLSDYLSNPASPTPVTYVVRTEALGFLNLPHDPNLNIERVSANITYWWHLRTNVT